MLRKLWERLLKISKFVNLHDEQCETVPETRRTNFIIQLRKQLN